MEVRCRDQLHGVSRHRADTAIMPAHPPGDPLRLDVREVEDGEMKFAKMLVDAHGRDENVRPPSTIANPVPIC